MIPLLKAEFLELFLELLKVDCFRTLLTICVWNWYKICFLLLYFCSSFNCGMPFPQKMCHFRGENSQGCYFCPVSGLSRGLLCVYNSFSFVVFFANWWYPLWERNKNLRQPKAFSNPVSVWLRLIVIAGRKVYPSLPPKIKGIFAFCTFPNSSSTFV